jgi:hypothetical protein
VPEAEDRGRKEENFLVLNGSFPFNYEADAEPYDWQFEE